MSFDNASGFRWENIDSEAVFVIEVSSEDTSIAIPYSDFLFAADFSRDGHDLLLSGADGKAVWLKDYFSQESSPGLVTDEGASLSANTVRVLAGPDRAGEYAQQGQSEGAIPIGQVETLTGSATVQRTDGTVEPLQVGTKVFQNDVVQTADGATLSITFADSTIFTLSSASRMVLSELVYAPEGDNNSSLFNLVQGSFVFVAGEVAKSGNMNVETPVATMGIRGTTVKVVIETDASGQATVTVSLNRDIDGSIGSIELINNLDGSVTQITAVESNWVISPADGITTEVPRSVSDFASDQAIINDAYQAVLSLQSRQAAGQQPVNLDDAGEDGGSGNSGEDDGEEGETPEGDETPGDQGNLGSGFGETGLTDVAQGDDGLGGTQISELGDSSAGLGTGGAAGGQAPGSQTGTGQTQNSGENDPGSGGPVGATIVLPTLSSNIDEDSPVVLSGFNISGGGGNLNVVLTAGSTIELAPGADVVIDEEESIEEPPGSGQYVRLVISGTASQVNNALNGATYRPSANDDDGGTLTVAVTSGGTTTTAVLQIGINPINDAPTLDAGTLVVNEDGPPVAIDLSGLGNDPDTGEDGSTLVYTTNIFSEFFENGVSITGTTLNFDPQDNFDFLAEGETTDVTISVTATDSEGLIATNDVTVTVTGENDAPDGFDNEGGDDPIVERVDGSEDENTGTITEEAFRLAFNDVDSDGTPPTFTAIGAAENDAAFESLVSFSFDYRPGSPAGSRDMVTVDASVDAADLDGLQAGQTVFLNYVLQITDSRGGSTPLNDESLEFQVRLVGTNDVPTLEVDPSAQLGENLLVNGDFENGPDGPGGVTTVAAGDSTTITGWSVVTGDVDLVTETSAFGAPSGDHVIDLNGNNPGSITQSLTVETGATYFVSFLMSGDPFDGESVKDVRVTAGADTHEFSYTSPVGASREDLSSETRSFSFVATDSSVPITFESLDLTDNNSGPFVDAVEVRKVNVVTNEDTSIVLPTATVGDDDDNTILSITLASEHGGQFSFLAETDLDGILNLSGNGTDTLSFDATQTDMNRVLMSVSFTPDEHFNGLEKVTVSVSDDVAPPQEQTILIGVTSVNDAPETTLPSGFAGTEDIQFTLAGISIADVDVGEAEMTVTFSVGNGSLWINAAVSGGIPGAQISGNTTNSVTVTGTIDQINATLLDFEGLTYTGNQDFNGQDILSVNVSDNGASGDGGPQSATDTSTIMISAVNDPVIITNTGQKVTARVPGNGEAFAASIDLNDNGVVVAGSPLADPSVGNDGLGFLFNPDQNERLGQPVELRSSLESANDFFGRSSAINNAGILAIGAPGDTNNQGAILVFSPDGEGGFTEQVLRAGTPVDGDFLGLSVDINSTGVIVATANGEDTAATGAGALYVFRPDGEGGYRAAVELFAPDAAAGDNLGGDVSINDAGVIVVGASLGDGLVGNTGTAYVFKPDGTGDYTDTGIELQANDGANGDNFGSALAINASGTIAVGAPSDGAGSVYVFTEPMGTYQQAGKISVDDIPATSGFGISLDLNNQGILVVGASGDDGVTENTGAVYVYTPSINGTYPHPPVKLYAPEGMSGDEFGNAVAINADGNIMVGAQGDDTDAGSAYSFVRDANGNYIHDGHVFISEGDQGTVSLVTIDLNELLDLSDVDDVPVIDETSITLTDNAASDAPFGAGGFSVNGTTLTVNTAIFDILNSGDRAVIDVSFNVLSGVEIVPQNFTINVGGITDNAINLVSATTLPGTSSGDDGTVNGTAGNDLILGEGTSPGSFQGDLIFAGDGDDILVGGNTGSELLEGGDGDDLIFPGNNSPANGDFIAGSLGNDRFNFGNVTSGFYDIFYSNLTASFVAIVATIDFATNTGSVQKIDTTSSTLVGTDHFVDVKNAYQDEGGLLIRGTAEADTYNVDAGQGNFFGVVAGRGNDIFNLESGIIRLEFRGESVGLNPFGNLALNGANVNLGLANNQVINDGFGFTDDINFTGDFNSGSGNRVEIRGTDFSDTLTGGPGDDRFIGEQGDDVIDGAGGVDMVRFDRSGAASIEADLENETATGFWDNTRINYTVRNIEDVRGSNVGVDFLSGTSSGVTDGANHLDGRAGVDVLNGRGGNDTLTGGSDSNVFIIDPVNGSDTIEDFVIGKDRIVIVDNGLGNTGDFNSFVFDGTDTLIGLGGTNMITVQEVDLVGIADPEGSFVFSQVSKDASGGFTAGAENSLIFGTGLGENISGGAGNDVIIGNGAGSGYFTSGDMIFGGGGNDLIIAKDGFSTIEGGLGDDRIQASRVVYVSDQLNWGDGVTVSYASSSSGITVNYTGDARSGLQAFQVSDGMGGTDRLGGITTIRDSEFDDVFFVDGNDATLRGNTGPRVSLGSGDDTVTFLGIGGIIDYHFAGDGVDASLAAGTATDRHVVDPGDQIGVDTFTGANRLLGSLYDDVLTGDTNNNRFRGREGNDVIDGGGGINSVEFFDTVNRVIVDLEDNDENGFQVDDDGHGNRDQLMNIQNVSGSLGNDILSGDFASNGLFGFAGNDLLIGKAGTDTLEGDSGNLGLAADGMVRGGDDFLHGGLDDDHLRGGADADVFFIASGDGFDFIDDFNFSEGDRIDISDFEFSDSSSIGVTYDIEDDSTFLDFTGTGVTVRGDLTGLTTSELDSRFIFNVQEGSPAIDDSFFGTAANDYFRPLDGDLVDTINSSGGNDTIDYVFAMTAFQNLSYAGNGTAITFSVDSFQNTASVDKGGSETDTIRNIFNPLHSGFLGGIGGFRIRGTDQGDTFHINTTTETWMAVRGGDGVDVYDIQNQDTGLVRIELRSGETGSVVDLSLTSGQIINDGFGHTESIVGPGHVWEIRGDILADNFTGSDNDESFITSGGNDFVDGGGGFDRVSYERGEFSSGINANLNLASNTVTGTFNNGGTITAFSDDLVNVEWIRGTRFDDVLTGTSAANRLQGRGGEDSILGGGGADTLEGGDGDDSLFVPDTGFSKVDGGAGNDLLGILGGGQVLDFTSLDDGSINSVELLSLGVEDSDASGTGTEITLDELNIISFSETFNPLVDSLDDDPLGSSGTRLALSDEALVITGDEDDTVNLAHSGDHAGASWQLAGNDNGFDVYNYSDASTTIASVAIIDEVEVNVVA